MHRAHLWLMALGLLSLSGCVDDAFLDAVMAVDGAGEEQISYDGPEALAWLEGNKNESALASNRFLETANAVRFVKSLYAAGAEKVVVPDTAINNDEDTLKWEGGPYADALVVTLPADEAKRAAVAAICEKEMRREGFDAAGIEEGGQVFLWWD